MYNVSRDFKSLTSFSLSKVITDRQVVGLLVNQTNSSTNSQRDRKSDRQSDDRISDTCNHKSDRQSVNDKRVQTKISFQNVPMLNAQRRSKCATSHVVIRGWCFKVITFVT